MAEKTRRNLSAVKDSEAGSDFSPDLKQLHQVQLSQHSPEQNIHNLDIVKHSDIANLQGQSVKDSKTDNSYQIIKKLEGGNQAQTYLAEDKNKQKKVVKIYTVKQGKQVADLEEKISGEMLHVNNALKTTQSAFIINNSDVAVISDYIEGKSLAEIVKDEKRVLEQDEVIDMLTQITEKYLNPMHKAKVVHKDIKPSNIICTVNPDKTKIYSLIDFGSIRENGSLSTLTGSLDDVTLRFTRFNYKNNATDDFYSLVKTACSLLNGKQPEFSTNEIYSKISDEEVIADLRINKKLKKVLTKMLGYTKKYENGYEILNDLRRIQQNVPLIEVKKAEVKKKERDYSDRAINDIVFFGGIGVICSSIGISIGIGIDEKLETNNFKQTYTSAVTFYADTDNDHFITNDEERNFYNNFLKQISTERELIIKESGGEDFSLESGGKAKFPAMYDKSGNKIELKEFTKWLEEYKPKK